MSTTHPIVPTVLILLLGLLPGTAPAAAETTGTTESAETTVSTESAEPLTVDLAPTARRAAGDSSTAGEGSDTVTRSAQVEVPEGISVIGLTWTGEEDSRPAVQVDGAAEDPGGTVALASDEHATEGTVVHGPATVDVALTGDVDDAQLTVWTEAVTARDAATVAALPPVSATGERLPVGSRDDWGADESLRLNAGTNDSERLGVTLHHTATANGYAAEEVPAILRTMYHYHAVTLGWGDIGYHALVDQHGRVWEGRAGGLENSVEGAHAYGMNRDWVGVSMIGNFETRDLREPERVATTATIGWFMNHWDVDPHGTEVFTNAGQGWTRELPTLHGHDAVGQTLCPGYSVRTALPAMRDEVAADMERDRRLVLRVAGADRYGTAAEMARSAHLEGTGTAYLARGDDLLADALGVGPVAAATGSAVLLSRTDVVPRATLTALEDLGVSEVVLVGGETALSPAVAEQLALAGYTVHRIAGESRYATAVQLARHAGGDLDGDTVLLASGATQIDALGGAAAAAELSAPLLLTRPGSLPGETLRELRRRAPARVIVLGSTGVVDEAVVDRLRAELPGAAVDRIGGGDRYETAALLASEVFGSAPSAVAAQGAAAVDALGASQLAAARGGPVLLTKADCLPGAVRGAVENLGVRQALLSGGSSVIERRAVTAEC